MGDHTKGSCKWTNERHMNYLSSIEASFVQYMYENNGYDHRVLCLDRQLPDSSDSTLDLKKHRIRRRSSSDIRDERKRTDKKTRRRSYEKIDSQDQLILK